MNNTRSLTHSNAWPARFLLAIVACCFLNACGQSKPTVSISQQASAALMPQDQELADIYQRSCKSCHTIAATGSPLTGDTAAWEPRMKRGMGAMLDSVINGYGGMPPLGLCMACTPEQFEQLIVFMASATKS